MATVVPHGKGWRVQIRREGFKPISKTFAKGEKGRAWAWAHETERELLAGRYVDPARHTLVDALDRYRINVSPTKRGHRWEKLRLIAMGRAPMAAKALGAVTSDVIGQWRDDSLAGRFRPRAVGPATVRREMNLLESVFEVARLEWKWVMANPVKDVKKPASPRARRRRVAAAEFRALRVRAVGATQREVLAGFELGMETGMRAGEMWSLDRPQVDLRARVAHLEMTKNGDERDVALSPRAVAIVRGLLRDGRAHLFTCTPGVRDATFRKLRIAAEIEDLHFHDSRAEGIWRLSKRFGPLELAEQVGHRDLKSLMLYYRDSAADRAKRLAGKRRRSPSPRRRATAGARRPRSASARGTSGA